ncbi:hypothetical protein G3T14_15670 [Methylobacterium sp. BTF04]|uniref:hypothetical protein n=1 Tax=Methylobacterium sp. BTF04 TaxID=2708300 RepID=UPI0013D656FD|nr:hypothetical protein [Methylobacterium sp. BTF04]NEU13558.1 hypothetical protein [Methylobacterium sp. BTF04]
MEQGTRLDSAPVSAAQNVRDDDAEGRKLDAAVTSLLTRPAPEAPERHALIAYASWLYMERQFVCKELYPHLGWRAATFIAGDNSGFDYHRKDAPAASSRAVAVLELIGCDWSKDRDLGVGDGGESFPEAKAFPHPDGRLIDLEQEYLAAHATYVSAYARETAARAEFARREAPYDEAEQHLLLRPAPNGIYWHGTYLRSVLSNRFAAVSASDAAVIDNLRQDQLEALMKPVEARDARREALAEELALDDLEAASEVALDAREVLAKKVYRASASTLDGIALKVRVLKINEPDLWKRPTWRGGISPESHEIALTEIADSVEFLISSKGLSAAEAIPFEMESAATTKAITEEIDWNAAPDGFMAYPAINPTGFINIREGLRLEAERLHGIALGEVARRASMSGVPEHAPAGWLDQLRRWHRVAELERAANPEIAIPTETLMKDGTVYYEDAAGKAHRAPVAHWIASMAQRMNSIARGEVARLFNAGAVADQDANGALYDELRRAHRIDALHDLAFRPDRVFEAARDNTVGSGPVSPRVAGDTLPDPILALIERHRQAHAEWLPYMEVASEARGGTPEYARAQADERGPLERDQDAYGSLFAARPTTLAGLIAWAGYMPRAVIDNAVDDETAEGVRALGAICDAVLSLMPIVPPAQSADHIELLAAEATSDRGLLVGLDLTAMPIRTLDALCNSFEILTSVCYGFAAQPRSQQPDGDASESGAVLIRLAEGPLADVIGACQREARQRVDTMGDDREVRAQMLARAIVENDDPDEMRAFARELVAMAEA